MRNRDHAAEVLPVELFFDLVYVLAITQLTHHLLTHLDWRGAAETLVLLLAVWLAWMHITWITNYFDLRARRLRLILLVAMGVSLVASASIPEAFADRALTFALAFSFLLIGGRLVALLLVGRESALAVPFIRVLAWVSVSSAIWVGGAVAGDDARLWVWTAATILSYTIMWFGSPLPGLGHSHTTDYTISGPHLAERGVLFITLAFGESIIITGSDFGDLPSSNERVAAFVVAFIGSVALWWLYFDRGAAAAARAISDAEDPGRIGLLAYTYCLIPMVAGVIVMAAGDEVAISHPGDEVTTAEAALILGGPALYLAGHTLFKLVVWEHVSPSRVVGIAALGALAIIATEVTALVLITLATAVVVAVAAHDFSRDRHWNELEVEPQPRVGYK